MDGLLEIDGNVGVLHRKLFPHLEAVMVDRGTPDGSQGVAGVIVPCLTDIAIGSRLDCVEKYGKLVETLMRAIDQLWKGCGIGRTSFQLPPRIFSPDLIQVRRELMGWEADHQPLAARSVCQMRYCARPFCWRQLPGPITLQEVKDQVAQEGAHVPSAVQLLLVIAQQPELLNQVGSSSILCLNDYIAPDEQTVMLHTEKQGKQQILFMGMCDKGASLRAGAITWVPFLG